MDYVCEALLYYIFDRFSAGSDRIRNIKIGACFERRRGSSDRWGKKTKTLNMVGLVTGGCVIFLANDKCYLG